MRSDTSKMRSSEIEERLVGKPLSSSLFPGALVVTVPLALPWIIHSSSRGSALDDSSGLPCRSNTQGLLDSVGVLLWRQPPLSVKPNPACPEDLTVDYDGHLMSGTVPNRCGASVGGGCAKARSPENSFLGFR